MGSFEKRTPGLDMPVKIADHVIEEAARNYRDKCGTNDALIYKDRIITFEYYLSLHLAAEEIRALARKFEGGSVKGEWV